MKNILFLIMLMPLFTVGQHVKKDSSIITTDSIAVGWGGWMPSGDGLIWPQGNLLYRPPTITYDTIKVKALVTTGKIKAPFEIELLEVIERGWNYATLAIYPPRVSANKYLTTDKKELPKTTTVWMAKPIN